MEVIVRNIRFMDFSVNYIFINVRFNDLCFFDMYDVSVIF